MCVLLEAKQRVRRADNTKSEILANITYGKSCLAEMKTDTLTWSRLLKKNLPPPPSWPWSLSSCWQGSPSRSTALAPGGSHQCWVAMRQSNGNVWIPTAEVKHEAFNALRRHRSAHLSDSPPLPAATRWQSVTRIRWFSCQPKWQDLCIYHQLSCKPGSDEVLPSLLASTSLWDGSGAEAGPSLWS